MNGAGSTRNAFYHDHPVSNPGGARPHIHLGAQQGERFERDITPADSISNVDFRSAPSSPQKVNGPPRIPTERRTTRTRPSSKNNIQIRAKSPSKDAPPQNPGKKEARDIQSPRMTNRPVEKPPIYPAKTEKVLPSWKHRISIVLPTTAPLACRTSIPPLSSQLHHSLEPKHLAPLSIDEQEAAILDDLLFVLMGYEGQYIRFVSSYDPSVENERLLGPRYKILPGLDPSLRDLTQSVLKTAKHYSAMDAFAQVLNRDEHGTTNHALSASIRKVFKDYFVLIAQLEHQTLTTSSFTLHQLHLHTLPIGHTMAQLYALGEEILRKNAILMEEPDEVVNDSDNIAGIIERLLASAKSARSSEVNKFCRGGMILRLLTERLSFMSGDPAARALLETLLRDASRPYMIMLNEWLHHGEIKDPHSEFFVREETSIKREGMENDYTDQYWEKRYTIRERQLPPQLEGVKSKVLLAGKYLNVVRECGGVDVSKEVRDVPNSFDDARFLNNVHIANAHANSSLLDLLLTTHKLADRLRSLKYYFFLDRSDFFTHFLDLSVGELEKPWKKVNVGKLQSLLDLVLRLPGSVAASVPFKEDIRVETSGSVLTNFLVSVISVQGFNLDGDNHDLRQFLNLDVDLSSDKEHVMTGFESLQFKYRVPFPLSLVISSNTVLRYQVLFRYLLSLRRVEEQLVNCWRDHHKIACWTHRSKNPRLEMLKRRTWMLRTQMLVFVQQIIYHCTSQVIEPLWRDLMSRIDGTSNPTDADHAPKLSRTVDELMKDHVDFLDTCLKECMLLSVKILRLRNKALEVCHHFINWTAVTTRQLWAADPSLAGSAVSLSYLASQFPSSRGSIPASLKSYDPTRLAKLEAVITRYEYGFHHHLQNFVQALDYLAATQAVGMVKLCAQLSAVVDRKKAERKGVGGVGPLDGEGEGEEMD